MPVPKFVGFFSELQVLPWDEHPSRIGDRTGVSYSRSAMAAYLSAGRVVFDVLEHGKDVIGGTDSIANASSLKTDGNWVWRNDLSFYVDHYAVALPAEFVESVVGFGYAQPAVSPESLEGVLVQIRRIYPLRPTVKRFNRSFVAGIVSAVIAESRSPEEVAEVAGVKVSMVKNWVAAARRNPNFLGGIPD